MNKKILYLEHCVDNTVGGSHYCLLEICRNIDKSHYTPVVAFYQSNNLVDMFKSESIDVLLLSTPQPFTLPDYLPRILSKIIRMPINTIRMLFLRVIYWIRILKKNNIDILHLNNTFTTDHDAIIAAKICGIPCVAHVRGIQPYIDILSRRITRRLSSIIAISEAVKSNLIKNDIDENCIDLVFDGITPERIQNNITAFNLHSHYNIPIDSKVIGIIGNVKEWKGQKIVVDAMLQLLSGYDGLYCFIVGAISDDTYYKKLLESIQQNKAENNIIFAGYQNNVSDFLKDFDVFIHASVEPEPFGIVILEAMALKKPVIVSNIGAPKEIVNDNESGLLFESGDSDSLCEKISVLLNDKDKRVEMGMLGFERLNNKFTSRINANAIENIYKRITKKGQ